MWQVAVMSVENPSPETLATPPAQPAGAVADADPLSGNATSTNIAIGQAAGRLTEVPGTTGPSGGFGEQADTIIITSLRQHTWLTSAGTFTLPGLSVSFSRSGG